MRLPQIQTKLLLQPLKVTFTALSFSFLVLQSNIDIASAAQNQNQNQKLIYKSGKTPFIEGSDKSQNDMSGPGGRKETSFLRCISNCKTKCQQPGEGLAKNDCVQDCQDQCCTSYEQCSFRIKSTAGNAI